jgi:hypothetical protein
MSEYIVKRIVTLLIINDFTEAITYNSLPTDQI